MAGYDFSRVTPRAPAQRRLSIEEIEAAALAGPDPTGQTIVNIAPEPPVEMALGPDRLVQAADAAFLNELDARGEPPIPDLAEAADIDLPPVQGAPEGYDFSQVTPRTSEPLVPTAEPEPGAGYDFSAVAAVRQPDPAPEAKPLNLSFGGQEAAIARAVRGPAKPPEPLRTDARARDDADVTFDPAGKAYKFTGLELVPDTGVMATDPLKRRPRLAPGGEVVFDATRFSQGITEARNEGLLSEEQFDRLTVQADFAEKVLEQRRKLEAKAGENPEFAAVLYGFGRGGAATAAAVAGAKVGGLAGLAGGPLAKFTVPAGAIAGAIGGGIAGSVGFDATYKQLAKHFEEYESVLAAAELRPGYAAGGQLATVALALPVSGVQAARGLRTAYEAGGMAQVARTAGAAAGTGAATGAIAAPIDAAVRGEAITPGTVATGAALGAAMGGFFIQGRKVGTAEVAQIFRKAETGVKLTASEEAIFRSAYGPLQSAVRRGQMDGQRMTDIAVEVPQSSVMGFAPATGRARVEARYTAPARLPEGALRAARAAAAARAEAGVPAGRTLPPAAPAAPGVIRTAPVNVLPSGTTPIVIPPPRSPAMLSPDEYAMTMGAERGLDMDFNPEATDALYAEHFELVKAAVDRNEPVSATALDLYEIRVPYYVPDGETGVARFDEPAYREYEAYMVGQRQDFREDMADAGGEELLAAVIDLGGLPAPKSGAKRAVFGGELKSLFETARAAGKGKGGDNQKGVFINKLFRKDAADLDDLVTGLAARGFRVDTPGELLEMLDVRLRTGNEIFGLPTQSMDDVPMSMRGRAVEEGLEEGMTRVFHGTSQKAADAIAQAGFDVNRAADGTIWFTTNRAQIEGGKVAASGAGVVIERLLDERTLKLGGWAETDRYSTDELMQLGFDGLRLPGDGEVTFQIFYPEKLIAPAARVAEGPDLVLAGPDPQAYFDFSNVPASKQAAGRAAVQAAAQTSAQPYQAAPVSAAGGVAGDVGLADARARQAAAYRALLGGDAAAVAAAIKDGVPLSRLMLGFITRESAPFNIKGAILKSPQDLAMYNLAHRTPFFESLKVAVLDDRYQVVHSQVVSVGTMNESLAHPRDFMSVVLAAKQANPQAKLTGFMIMHNHPSGKTDPSEPDKRVTTRFAEAGEMFDLPLIDHVITNGETFFSFREHGLIQPSRFPTPDFAPDGSPPLLPVLPRPAGEIAPGQMASYEATPASASSSLRMGDSDNLSLVQQTLQTADPNMIHVINVDTQNGIVSVMRHPLTVTAAEIMRATTPAAAYGMFLSLPSMPPAEAATLVRRVREAADLMQIFLLDAAVVGMPATLKQQGLLEEPEVPYAAGSVQTDPLAPTPIKLLRGAGPEVRRGTAAPRPGVARTTTTPRPEWVLQPGETGEGRRLIKGIENYKRGQKWGMRQIIDLVNRAVKLEMRASRSQTTRKHPANYRPANHVAFTRNTQSQINFHEAGHGLYELMEARVPGFWKQYEAELMPLVDREGSMASANSLHEATAEWLRLLLVDPPAVADLPVTAALAEAAEQFYPRMAAMLRDGARAVNRFQNQPAATKWAMLNADPRQTPPSWGEFLTSALRGGTAATNFLSSGAPVFKLDRGIFRAIMADGKEVGLGWQGALKLAREIRKETSALQAAYNMVLSIGAETTTAMSGTGPMRGVRVMGPDGKYKQLTKESYRDYRLKVPAAKLRQFDEAAWAKESLSRYEYFTDRAIVARDAGDTAAMRVAMQQRLYPGMLEGLTTKDLAEIVSAARLEIPRFEEYFREQSAWFDAVLNVKEFGGLKKPGEVKAMMGARDTYWPLPKVMAAPRAARGRSSRGDIMAGDRGIQGSGEPIRAVDEVAEERVRQAYDAYYWNRFGTIMVDRMQKVAADTRLPAEARIMAGQAAVRLTVPQEKVATLSAEEIVPWVLDAVATMMAETLGFKPDLSPDDVQLSFNFKDVFRPGRPDDINVISLLRNGEREFYQLGDPGMFAMFASPQNASRTTALLRWLLGPSLQNWKRNITQSFPFAFQNLFGDIFNQTMLNPDKVGWFPGGATLLGMMNKYTQKYPQVFQDGLLLARVEPSATELLQQVRHNAVWQWMTEGFYVSTSKNPVTRVVQTALQPSNYLFPLFKLADVINLITLGRTLAPIFETATREGAAVYKLMKGATDEEALASYWQVSGRFNEHAGNADVRALMQMPGFFNPMVQAFRGGMQNLTDPDPAVSGKSWVKLLTLYPSIFGGAAITAYLLMNEDEKERERERALEDRLSYYPVGGMRIRFPYGPEGAMGSLVYNSIMDDLLGRPKTEAKRGAGLLLKRIIDPGGGPLQFFGPQLAAITEASMNWSTFRQKHIVAPWMTTMPASEQYYSTTPEFYKKLGEMMNYSPIKLQYIVTQAISRQADETIRLVEAIDRGRPLMEDADIPFVGRMFMRNPTGMASQSVKDLTNVGERLRLLDSRLAAKGWSMLRDPDFPTEKIADRKLVQLQTQLQYLELLRYGVNQMSKISEVGKVYRLQEDYVNEANARTMMMRYAQSLLAGNTDQIATIDQALELLQEIPKAPPEQVAADYLQRRN